MAVAALVVSVVTLLLAIFIHSETRDIFSRVNLMIHTLPGAHDMKRCIEDIEKSQEERATIVCDAPKNTHVDFIWPAPNIPRLRRMRNGFWRFVRKSAGYWSGDIFRESMVKESVLGKWEIKSRNIDSADLDELLGGGWEPFSVANGNQVWVRKHRNQDS